MQPRTNAWDHATTGHGAARTTPSDHGAGRPTTSDRPATTADHTVAPRRRPPHHVGSPATTADLGVGHYVRLEQGRASHPSPEVLDALARALLLDDVERRHLHDLVSRPDPAPRPERVRPELQHLLDRLDGIPAFVLNPRMDVLAWNHLAAVLITDFGARPPERRNVLRFMFLDAAARTIYPHWERCARDNVGFLRRAAGQDPDDSQLAALVGELSVKSEEFARWWGTHEVREKTYGSKRYRHPVVGELTVHYETLTLAEAGGQSLVTYTTEPGSESETALRLLAAWAAG